MDLGFSRMQDLELSGKSRTEVWGRIQEPTSMPLCTCLDPVLQLGADEASLLTTLRGWYKNPADKRWKTLFFFKGWYKDPAAA